MGIFCAFFGQEKRGEGDTEHKGSLSGTVSPVSLRQLVDGGGKWGKKSHHFSQWKNAYFPVLMLSIATDLYSS